MLSRLAWSSSLINVRLAMDDGWRLKSPDQDTMISVIVIAGPANPVELNLNLDSIRTEKRREMETRRGRRMMMSNYFDHVPLILPRIYQCAMSKFRLVATT